MPTSMEENKDWIVKKILSVRPETVLDVGAGAGRYAELLGQHTTIDAIEVWEPYIKEYNLERKYRSVFHVDARAFAFDIAHYDVVIFGDVIEHMTEAEAVKMWTKAAKGNKYGVISLPVVHWPQGEEFGNPYEVHVEDDYSVDRVLKTFEHITVSERFSMTGAFFAEFPRSKRWLSQ